MAKKKSKQGRPKIYPNTQLLSIRFNRDQLDKVREIAVLESYHSGKTVTMNELIRQAVNYVYEDGERLRESFRRTRFKKTGEAYG